MAGEVYSLEWPYYDVREVHKYTPTFILNKRSRELSKLVIV